MSDTPPPASHSLGSSRSSHGSAPRYQDAHVTFATTLADQSRQIMSGALLARPAIELKPDSSYVTDTDKGIERALRAKIFGRTASDSAMVASLSDNMVLVMVR